MGKSQMQSEVMECTRCGKVSIFKHVNLMWAQMNAIKKGWSPYELDRWHCPRCTIDDEGLGTIN